MTLFEVVAAVRSYLHPHQRAETRLRQPCSCSCCFQTATEKQKVEKDVTFYLDFKKTTVLAKECNPGVHHKAEKVHTTNSWHTVYTRTLGSSLSYPSLAPCIRTYGGDQSPVAYFQKYIFTPLAITVLNNTYNPLFYKIWVSQHHQTLILFFLLPCPLFFFIILAVKMWNANGAL